MRRKKKKAESLAIDPLPPWLQPMDGISEPRFHPEWVGYDPESFKRACDQFTEDMKRWEEQERTR